MNKWFSLHNSDNDVLIGVYLSQEERNRVEKFTKSNTYALHVFCEDSIEAIKLANEIYLLCDK